MMNPEEFVRAAVTGISRCMDGVIAEDKKLVYLWLPDIGDPGEWRWRDTEGEAPEYAVVTGPQNDPQGVLATYIDRYTLYVRTLEREGSQEW